MHAHKQIVAIVGNPAGKGARGFRIPGLDELLFQAFSSVEIENYSL
ncbi:MAG: hypothetical protein QG555_820 [Thermodesulfobacteriota bacterium]|nr:hypothetical protein [Thermodesulfobacteriota bacterium]